MDLQQQTNADTPRSTDERDKDSRIGLILDSKYKLIESLGEGGMGSVFRAERLHIGDQVAVKLLHHDLAREKQALERFRREARTAAMIRHPNIVSIHDFSDGTANGTEAYIVMELVQGVSLGNLLRREGRMTPKRAVHLMHDICTGVGVAHRRGLLHRDLKPDNVIVAPPSHEGDEEIAKVVDFGLAKVRDVGATALTKTGVVLGTLYYMSPEQCSGEELDARADVYSLGAMFYEMLTGNPPFRANNMTGLISKHLHEQPPLFPRTFEISPALESVCMRALAKDRNQRPPDAIAFGRDLQKALAAPVVRRPAPSRPSPWKWIVAALGVFFALILLVVAVIVINYVVARMKASRDVAVQTQTQSAPPVVPISNIDLKGTWAGTYGPLGYATKLVINEQNGNSVDGQLEQGSIRVAFKGTYEPASRTLTMKQTEVLSGEGWNLGEDVGTVSDDGKTMTGTGKDPLGESLGIAYQWTFSRK
jgi:serine/threonine protein kinase